MNENKWCGLWFGGVGLFFALTYLLAPIFDTDFFWHLKTGEWILLHRQLPSTDPFSLLAGQSADPRQLFTLNAYWLSQVVYAALTKFFGLGGIFALRYILMAGLFVALWQWRSPSPRVHAVLVTMFFLFFFGNFTIDRPQTFTFLFFAIQLLLVERLRSGCNVHICGASLLMLMLVWGNMHGGVMVGQVYLLCVLFDLGIESWKKKGVAESFRWLFGWLVLALLVSFCNPNVQNFSAMYSYLAAGSNKYDNVTSEYRSAISALSIRHSFFFYFFTLLASIVFVAKKKFKIERVGSYVFFVLLAASSAVDIRYVPLFLILSIPFVTRGLSALSNKILVASGLCFFLLLFFCKEVRRDLPSISKLKQDGPVWNYYPTSSAGFINNFRLHGNFYTHINWGGYLLWALNNEQKIFIDSRNLYFDALDEWIFFDRFEGNPDRHRQNQGAIQNLKRTLEKYAIDYLILPKTRNGQLSWMVGVLAEDHFWKLAFDQDNAVVFVRRR